MKFIFFLLLLANIAFYMWQARLEHGDNNIKRVALNLPDSSERIKLLAEIQPAFVDQMQTTAASSTPAKQTALEPPLAAKTIATPRSNPGCWLWGPYPTELNARIAQESIARKVQLTAIVNRSASSADGYWLLYPKAKSIEAGRDNRRMLQDKGIQDLWLFDKGELAGYISLGLFQSLKEAELAQKKYFEHSITTEIHPREMAIQGYWIEISWQNGRSQLESLLNSLGKPADDERLLTLYPC